jgi:hypothetical protein
MLEYVKNVIIPEVQRMKEEKGIAASTPALCILDVFKAHRVDQVVQLFNENNIKLVFVPANCTGELQPLDLAGNAEFKNSLKASFIDWYAEKVKVNEVDDIEVDLRLSTMKPIHAQWMVTAWEALKENRQAILNGWSQAGIKAALQSAREESRDEVQVINIVADSTETME